MKDAKGHGSNPRGAHSDGVNNVGTERVYRGESRGTGQTGNFWTPDREWARQFTQSGQDNEIREATIDQRHIHEATHVYAGDPASVDKVIAEARGIGKKAVRLNEGRGEPNSLFVFDKSALRGKR